MVSIEPNSNFVKFEYILKRIIQLKDHKQQDFKHDYAKIFGVKKILIDLFIRSSLR